MLHLTCILTDLQHHEKTDLPYKFWLTFYSLCDNFCNYSYTICLFCPNFCQSSWLKHEHIAWRNTRDESRWKQIIIFLERMDAIEVTTNPVTSHGWVGGRSFFHTIYRSSWQIHHDLIWKTNVKLGGISEKSAIFPLKSSDRCSKASPILPLCSTHAITVVNLVTFESGKTYGTSLNQWSVIVSDNYREP